MHKKPARCSNTERATANLKPAKIWRPANEKVIRVLPFRQSPILSAPPDRVPSPMPLVSRFDVSQSGWRSPSVHGCGSVRWRSARREHHSQKRPGRSKSRIDSQAEQICAVLPQEDDSVKWIATKRGHVLLISPRCL